MGSRRRLLGIALGFCVSIFSAGSQAQPAPGRAPNPKADALFKEARALIAKGNYEEACPKLEESRRIEAGMGTVFNLADCYEHIGRTASAWASFMDVATAADAAGQPERARVARQRAESLAPKIPKLRIVVSPELSSLGVEVRRDGVPVGSLLWGTDVPIDPGRHRIIASAPGRSIFNTAVDVLEPGKVVVVEIPLLAPEGEGDARPIGGGDTASGSSAPLGQPDERRGRSAGPAIALGALALAGASAGVGLFVAASSSGSSADALRSRIQGGSGELNGCLASPKPPGCDELATEVSGAKTLRGLSIGAFVVGGLAAAGAAAYLLWPAPATLSTSSGFSVRVLPVAGRASGGVELHGRY
jgi:hypothetical protein